MNRPQNLFMAMLCGLVMAPSAPLQSGPCTIPELNRAIREVTGREPRGSGLQGECDPARYNVVVEVGKKPSYEEVRDAVKAALGSSTPTPPAGTRQRATDMGDRCFGAVGPNCEGAPGAGRTVVSSNLYVMRVAIGSILHDNCCVADRKGKWCSGPLSAIVHSGGCVKEWDKAVSNVLSGRHWSAIFNPTQVPDLTWQPPRPGSPYRASETVATRRLSAPRGTPLDTGDQAFCASGRARTMSNWFGANKWIVCE